MLSPQYAEPLPAEWSDLDVLCRYIVDRHHYYVRGAVPAINTLLEKLAGHHGERHAELAEVRTTFRALGDELLTHMMKEENILFPFISALAAAKRRSVGPPPSPFGTILHPVRVMEEDHRLANDLMGRLRVLTTGFVAPDDGCETYRVCYAELGRFEEDLHRHIHLENDILFPQAIELEERLT